MEIKENRIAPVREQSGKGTALAKIHPRLRGLLALILCACLAPALLPAPALAADPATSWANNADTSWYTGSPTANQYIITTAAELAGLSKLVNDGTASFQNKTIHLGDDIDLAGHLWVPIGLYDQQESKTAEFRGTLNGGHHTVSGMVVNGTYNYAGFFGILGSGASVYNLQLANAAVTNSDKDNTAQGGIAVLAGLTKGKIYDCSVVSGSVTGTQDLDDCGNGLFVGGLVGRAEGSSIQNCSVQLSSITAAIGGSHSLTSGEVQHAGGIAAWFGGAATTVENCFAAVDTYNVSGNSTSDKKEQIYAIAPDASCSYWKMPNLSASVYNEFHTSGTGCYEVSAGQIAGTGSTVIGPGSANANTPSLMTALNNWVGENSGHSEWIMKGDSPVLSIFHVINYIDITTVPNQSKEGAAGQVNADVKLEGQVQENVVLISVTLPASIPFIMDVDAAGSLNRVLSATATLTNRSDVGVTVTLTEVEDNDPTTLLDKANFVLVPDPNPTGNPVPLSAGTNKADVLAVLDAPADGVPTTSQLKVDGAAKADNPSLGSDGDSFIIGLTLKVTKTP